LSAIEAQLAAALAHLDGGRIQDAETVLAALGADQDPRVAYLRGLAALRASRADEAAALLARAAHAFPDQSVVLADLGVALDRAGRHAEALAALERAAILAPGEPSIHHQLGLTLFALNRREQAAAALRTAAAAAPDRIGTWLALGECLQAQRRHDEAAQAYARAALLAPGDAGIALRQAALAYDRGDDTDALEAADRALRIDPGLAAAWRERAGALRRQGRLDEALASAGRALQLDGEDADALKARGHVLQELGRLDEAAQDFLAAARRHYAPGRRGAHGRDFRSTTRAKLRHDIEQLRYLHARGLLASGRTLAERLQHVLERLPPCAETASIDWPAGLLALIDGDYNRLHHLAEAPRIAGGALNPALDPAAIEADYFGRGPGIAWIDGLLRPEALATLRRYCLESTFWFDFHHANGYLGAYFAAGFGAPLLLQIAEELAERLPGIFAGHGLTQLWAYKYDSRLDGIELHADIAAVNLNFWITPDEANLDPDRGGLLVWDREAPPDWGFDEFNTSTPDGQARIRRYLETSGARMVRVPHRQNRAVLFNSDLFHRTDHIRFREGYGNRRINITMLMGRRHGRVR
jgi:tetratricopeptide (TPR) repeat protein